MKLAALTCRSVYSLLRGAVWPKRWAECSKELGYDAFAMADVNGLYGAFDFNQAGRGMGIAPIFGTEILTASEHVILLIENRCGYRNVCRLLSAFHLDEEFSLAASLVRRQAGLICLCGPGELAVQLGRMLDGERLFVLCREPAQAQWARSHRLAPLAGQICNITNETDGARLRLVDKIRSLSTMGPGPTDSVGQCCLPWARQVRRAFREHREALTNHEAIIGRCKFRLPPGRYYLPRTGNLDGRSADEKLARVCHVGAARRYGNLTEPIVKRLEYELGVIRQNEFSDYFLMVRDIVDFAKGRDIPVDVRGSAAGALVSYVLGFTRVCPLEHKLYFERFMNPGRLDCPDIDIDLCWRRRDEVINFCYEHWGYDHVAMISTLNCYRRRSALRDVGRAIGLEPVQIDEIVNDREKSRPSPVYRLADAILGMPRHLGLHCGGLVITPRPLHELAPLQRATKGVIVTQYDKNAAEAMGLIKMDLLGNRSLSTVHEAVEIIGQKGCALDIDGVARQDECVGRMLAGGDSLGVFQCESPGMRQLLRGLNVRNQHDMAIALSLIRPGPAAGGMKAKYIERHVEKKSFAYLHAKLRDVLGETYGVMLYQEDVMRIAVELAGYSVADADQFRSEVSKQVSSERLHGQYKEFVYRRAVEAGIDRPVAEALWDEILRFAAYSYCKAHATVYANIAWQTAYLKAHYPGAFYTAILNNHHGMYPLRVYVWDAIRHGVKVCLPHVNHSEREWRMEGKAIRAGLQIVKGLSSSAIEAIMDERRRGSFGDLNDLRRRVRFRRGELSRLIQVGACDGLGPSRPAMLLRARYDVDSRERPLLFDLYEHPSDSCLPDYDRVSRLQAEVRTTDIPFSMHPAMLLRTRHTWANRLERHLNQAVRVAGFVAAARTAKTSSGKTMGFVTLEDVSGLAEVSFYPEQLDQYRQVIGTAGAVWIAGKVSRHLSTLTLEAEQAGRAY